MGEVPDKPSVETDMRRRWSWTAATAMGPTNGVAGLPVTLLERPKMLLKVCVVNEPRRAPGAEEEGEELSLFDMVEDGLVGGGVIRSHEKSRAVEIGNMSSYSINNLGGN